MSANKLILIVKTFVFDHHGYGILIHNSEKVTIFINLIGISIFFKYFSKLFPISFNVNKLNIFIIKTDVS